MSSEKTDVVQTLVINDGKAGMQGLDKDRINQIIHEASRGTHFFEHQLMRQRRIDKRAKEMEISLRDFSDLQRQKANSEMDSLAGELEASRDLSKVIVHIDMDAFFAAVEIRDEPGLADKPVAVGSMSMLSTSNYRARMFGVRAAMPGFIAKKLCPNLIIVPLNYKKYASVSEQLSTILHTYTSEVLMMSLDEAYIDITENVRGIAKGNEQLDLGDVADALVDEIRRKIFEITGLTASAGIAPNMMLAKVCSDRNKPNGQFRLASDAEFIRTFVSELPLRKISGIGPVQDQLFANLGIVSCCDLWENRDILPLLFTPSAAHFYLRAAMGLGSTCIHREGIRKSIGTEESFRELNDPEELYDKCKELCHDLAEDMAKEKLVGKVLVLKIKNIKFEVTTRNLTLGFHTCDEELMFKAAKQLLDREILAVRPSLLRLRLMGIRLQSLIAANDSIKQSILPFKKDAETMSYFNQTENILSDTQCPICARKLSTNNLDEVNTHIDCCLSGQTIKEILASDQTSKRKGDNSENASCGTKKLKTSSNSITRYFQAIN